MEIINQRFGQGKESTGGLISINDLPICFVIEDQKQESKIKDETRIPQGKYRLGIRKEVTPLTEKSRQKPQYEGWFEYFIEVLNVREFTGIYFHIGNTEKDTSGCQLLNMGLSIVGGEFVGASSQMATKMFYDKVYPVLKAGKEDVFYIIKDEL